MAVELDETDQRILGKLMEDASKSLAHIARELDLPRPTVNYRIQRMRKNGIIQKFTVLRDYAKLGQGMTTFVFVRHEPGQEVTVRELAERVAELEAVYEVHLITGEWDLLLKVRTEDLEEVGSLLLDRLRRIEGVGATLTSSALLTVKEEV